MTYTFDDIDYVIVEFFIISGAQLVKLLTTYRSRILPFFAKHSLDWISLEIVNRHALNYVLAQVTVNAPLVRVKLVQVTDNP